MDDKLARQLVKSLERNSAALEAHGKLLKALLGTTGSKPPGMPPGSPQRNVDPLTAQLRAAGIEE